MTADDERAAGYHVDDHEVALERERLGHLATARDPRTIEVLSDLGVEEGWRCLEIGAGSGSISRWMGDRVGDTGSVLSTDVDLRFHEAMPANVEVRRHDVASDALPAGAFDLIHARAVLQHIPSRDEVVGSLVEALRPGGRLVIEDGSFAAFAAQPLPEPYATIHGLVAGAVHDEWRDPEFGIRVPHLMARHGLVDIDVTGDVWAMRPGEPAGDWWFQALERAVPRLVELGVTSEADGAAALAQVAHPDFVMVSTLSICTTGRRSG